MTMPQKTFTRVEKLKTYLEGKYYNVTKMSFFIFMFCTSESEFCCLHLLFSILLWCPAVRLVLFFFWFKFCSCNFLLYTFLLQLKFINCFRQVFPLHISLSNVFVFIIVNLYGYTWTSLYQASCQTVWVFLLFAHSFAASSSEVNEL